MALTQVAEPAIAASLTGGAGADTFLLGEQKKSGRQGKPVNKSDFSNARTQD
ncbi:MAG: hypothetical protein KME26_04965 [Oscillatoria princeps RMCB-10]|nr:hypothetical protein [Oscillatoria princeps RMCB-10]